MKSWLLIPIALCIFANPLQAHEDYPDGSFVKINKQIIAYDVDNYVNRKGVIPAGGIMKITRDLNDGFLEVLYKSTKQKKLIPLLVLAKDLEGSQVKKPLPLPTAPIASKPALPSTAYRPHSDTFRALAKTRGISFAKLNEALGHALWQDDLLWDDPAQEVAERINWPIESATETQISYRLYAGEGYRLLDARPFSLALYARQERPTYLSMIFSNKGDIDALPRGLNQAMREDEQLIEDKLSAVLGSPRTQIFGQGNMKNRVKRWDWENHALLLAAPKGEYVGVRILPSGVADAEGKGMKVRDAEIKQLLSSRVIKRSNGDTLVSQIPMVDQGPKGYCVPATWERYLRYMEIPADMYLLAMAGDTAAGGGTNIKRMIDQTKNLVMRYGRRLRDIDSEFTVDNIGGYIEQGMPIIWIMASGPKYNEAVSTYTRDRKEAEWNDWLANLEDRSASMKNDVKDEGHHACMIIGYNAQTRELAVSDSWGASFAERWIPMEAARSSSQYILSHNAPAMYVIRW